LSTASGEGRAVFEGLESRRKPAFPFGALRIRVELQSYSILHDLVIVENDDYRDAYS
jgi:hypothetical protein